MHLQHCIKQKVHKKIYKIAPKNVASSDLSRHSYPSLPLPAPVYEDDILPEPHTQYEELIALRRLSSQSMSVTAATMAEDFTIGTPSMYNLHTLRQDNAEQHPSILKAPSRHNYTQNEHGGFQSASSASEKTRSQISEDAPVDLESNAHGAQFKSPDSSKADISPRKRSVTDLHNYLNFDALNYIFADETCLILGALNIEIRIFQHFTKSKPAVISFLKHNPSRTIYSNRYYRHYLKDSELYYKLIGKAVPSIPASSRPDLR